MDPVDNVYYLLQRVAFVLSRQSDQLLQERFGIGLSQFKILRVLQYRPNVQQREIAMLLDQTEASVSRQIKLMVDGGLLTSRVSEENRRKHLTTLTERGRKLAQDALNALDEYHRPIVGHLSEAQQAQFGEMLALVYEAASQHGPQDSLFVSRSEK